MKNGARLATLLCVALLASARVLAYEYEDRTGGGFGGLLTAAVLFGVAAIFAVVFVGAPPAIINRLTGRSPGDDFGGKVFALSFVAGPVLGGIAAAIVERDGAAVAFLVGWVASFFVLGWWLGKKD